MSEEYGTVRIIGGRFKGKKLTFPIKESLRPTPDRVRETLFNWLMGDIVGANCLDLFTGTGAVALEALSRGAAHVTCVDHDASVIHALKKNALMFGHQITLMCAPYQKAVLSRAPFDIVFLDPPFLKERYDVVAQWLESHQYLSEKALIYVETKKSSSLSGLPENWVCSRHSSTSTIAYYLFMRD